jgi:hypothetical protein
MCAIAGCHAYLAEPDDAAVLRTAFNIYKKVGGVYGCFLGGGVDLGRGCFTLALGGAAAALTLDWQQV